MKARARTSVLLAATCPRVLRRSQRVRDKPQGFLPA